MSEAEIELEETNTNCGSCIKVQEEVRYWYLYDFGIGPFALAVIVFSPLLVVTQAKYEAASEGIEWRHVRIDGDICVGNITIHSNQDFARPDGIDDNCEWFPIDTKLPGLGVDYTSLTIYISTVVLFFSAIALIVFGPIGDYGSNRKSVLQLCTGVWALFYVVPVALKSANLYLVNSILIFVGATAWNFGNRALRNAYLPLLVQSDPAFVQRVKQNVGLSDTNTQDDAKTRRELNTLAESLTSRYSLETSAIFFIGQVLGFAVQGLLVTLLKPSETQPQDTLGLRLALAFAGTFGFCFCTYAISGLKTRPGPEYPNQKWYTVGTWKFVNTLMLIKKEMKQMSVFLIGRTLHWTAVQSLLTTSTLYIQREFSMRADELVLPLVLMLVASLLSALFLTHLVKKYESVLMKVTLALCCTTNLIPIYMLLGMRQKWEIFFLFGMAGILVSPFTALSRGILAQMIPTGFSSTIMSLEGILELGTSWIGPLIIGLIVDLTGSIRWGCFSMAAIMLPALPFLFKINMTQALEDKKMVEASENSSTSNSLLVPQVHLQLT